MSYVVLSTNSFDAMVRFYGEGLLFPVVAQWDQADSRGRRFFLGGGLQLEILDNVRATDPLRVHPPGDRIHLVVEVSDIEAAREFILVKAPPPQPFSPGARFFQVRDPDGILVTFLEWDRSENQPVGKVTR